MPAFMFVQDYKGDMLLTDYSFLIEHQSSGRRVLFDLGLRKVRTSLTVIPFCASKHRSQLKFSGPDLQDLKYPSKLDKMFKVWKCTAPSSPPEILRSNGVNLESIDTVIFSHTHL